MRGKQTKVIFYGGLWGGIEASLGYFMHMFFLPFTGFVMFPIGAYFMHRAMVETEDRHSAIYVACVAAAIKCVDFMMPGILPIKVINPVIGILLQGLVMSVFLAVYKKDLFTRALSASLIWRLVFISIVIIESLSGTPMRLLQSGVMGISRYLVVDSLVNGFLIYALVRGLPYKKYEIKPALAVMTFIVGISLNVIL